MMVNLRLMVAAFLVAWINAPMAAQAAEAPLSAYQCAVAYKAAGKERGRFQAARLKYGADERSFVELVPNAEGLQAYQYDERASKLSARIEKDAKGKGIFTESSVGAAMDSLKIADVLARESNLASSDARLNPKAVYVQSRAIFEQVHACDMIHGYTPVIGLAPSPEQVIALLIKQADDKRDRLGQAYDARQAELAGLDDVQCAARFALLGQLSAQNPQIASVMQQKTAIAGDKAVAARSSLPQERVIEEVRRAAQERATRIKGQSDVYPLVQEANACETRYGMGLTTMGQ